MNKYVKRIISVTMSFVILIAMNSFVFALEEKNDISEEESCEMIHESSRAMKPCPHCGELCGTVCARDAQEYDRGTHSYWSGGIKTCTVVYLRSRQRYYCASCNMYAGWYYNDAGTSIPYHDCWQVHQNCSTGWYHVCPVSF